MSSGMKQKVAIIAAVMHKPRLLILDEPTRGLDAATTALFKDLIMILKIDYKTTILFCSHIFDEIAKICDRVGFIEKGMLIKEYVIDESNVQTIETEFLRLFKTKNAKSLF